MKHFKTRFVALCGLVVLMAAALAPIVAEARCPTIPVACSNGDFRQCTGTQQGTKCLYDSECLNC